MGTRASYAPGTFNWVDLRTTDLAGARRFYAELFGWSYTNMDPSGGTYLVASVAGDAVAGLKLLHEGQAAGGESPFWLNYVAVDGADAAAARTRELGGMVRAEPFDRGAERFTVIADPTGGKLCLRQSPERIGACRVNEPGCLTWNELRTNDVSAAIQFYTGLFGWRIEPVDTDTGTGAGSRYWTIGHDGAAAGRNGGVRELDEPEGVLPRWMPHFAVASLDEALARTSGAGGRTLAGPLDAPDGRSAIVRDPQGAVFGVFDGRLDG